MSRWNLRLSPGHGILVGIVCAMTTPAIAQQPEPPAEIVTDEEVAEPQANPEALKAFGEIVKAWRSMPGLGVKTTMTIEMKQGEAAARSSEVKGEFLFGQRRHAVLKLKGFTVYLNKQEGEENGTFTAVHEKNANNYFVSSDDGSPYYAVFAGFSDMPFPELAIMLGEDEITDVVQQFHPKVWDLQPSAVAIEKKDDKDVEHLTMSGNGARFDLYLDPKTKLINSSELEITGGVLVGEGATMTYKYAYEYDQREQPFDAATFKFDPEQRQRVDLVSALMPQPEPPAAGEGGDDMGGGGQLVGKPAPPVTLATADGKAFDLADENGKVVVLDFWASWCGPCMQGLPNLHDAAKWASEEQLPVTFMTINVFEVRQPPDTPDARLASALKTWKNKGFTLPIAMDYSDQTAGAYGVQGIPTTIIIRSDGIVHAQHVGAADVETLKSEIQDALKAVEPPQEE